MSDAHTVVLVEGASDKSAIEALAGRRGRNLASEPVPAGAIWRRSDSLCVSPTWKTN